MILILILIFFISLIGSFGFLDYELFVYVISFTTIVYGFFFSRKTHSLIYLFFFCFLFILYATPSLIFHVNIVRESYFSLKPYYIQTFWTFNLFWSTFFISFYFLNKGKIPNIKIFEFKLKKVPKSIHYIIGITIIISYVFFIKGNNIYLSSNTYSSYYQNLHAVNGLAEYLIILFFLLYAITFSNFQKKISTLVTVGFVIKLTLLGVRVPVIMVGLLYWFYFIKDKSYKFHLMMAIIFFFLGTILGLIKVSQNIDYLMASILVENGSDGLVSHHGNVLWASSVLLREYANGFFSISDYFNNFSNFIFSSFLPSSSLNSLFDISSPTVLLQMKGLTSGGVLFSAYLYYMFGVSGIILTSFFYAFIVYLANKGNKIAMVYFIMISATFPRWVSYDIPGFFIKIPLYALVFTLLLLFITKKYRKV